MSWIFIAIIGYFFLALVNIGDKIFLGNFIPNYKSYTILIGFLGLIIFVIAPWFLVWPGLLIFIISLISGTLFIAALLSFFYSLKVGEASRVIPFIGGLTPIFSLVLSVVFLSSIFTANQLVAFLLLIIGSTLIVRTPHSAHRWDHIWEDVLHPQRHFKEVIVAVLAALFFSASFVSSKYVFDNAEFLNGFMWVRLGSFLAIIFLIFNRKNRQAFSGAVKKIKSKTGLLFIGNQGFGAIGFFLQNLSISLGSVALVNALQGVQYVFVIGLAALASFKFPEVFKGEKIEKKIIVEKIIAIVIIASGLAILTF